MKSFLVIGLCSFLILSFYPIYPTSSPSDEKDNPPKVKKEEKKEEKKKEQTVFTDEDLKKNNDAKVTVFEVDPGTVENKKYPPQDENNPNIDPIKTEKYWRAKKELIEKNIREARENIKKTQSELNALQTKYFIVNTALEQTKIKKKMDKTASQLEAYKHGLAQFKKQLEDLPEEARKAGALPGWVR